MSVPATKSVPSLTVCCQNLLLRYVHHVVWRRVDPPNPGYSQCYRPADLKISCPLPAKNGEQKDPLVFRKNFRQLRRYFSENLVRPVHEALNAACHSFVFENRLKGGDVLLSLVFHDKHTRSLKINAKHMVYRKWTIREDRTLHRTLKISQQLVKLALPGKGEDRILIIVATYCPLLEELDISNSFVTDKGLLALCGVTVEEVEDEKEEKEEEEEKGQVSPETGKFVRASAARAMENLEKVKHDPTFLRDLATGHSAATLLKHKFSSLTSRMKPYIEKRSDPSLSMSWSPRKGIQYCFSGLGCRKMQCLDINRTNYPKRNIDPKGEVIVHLGLTRDSVLCALLLLQELKILRWTELGEILQLYDMVFGESGMATPELNLTFLCDNRLTMDKLEVTRKLCPRISKLDISMFNFSFDEQEFLIGLANDEVHPTEDKFGKTSSMYFEFRDLRDLEVQYLDDSKAFRTSIERLSSNLTRICLNKMVSISFETLAAIKRNCRGLNVLEVYVDYVFTVDRLSTLEQVIVETQNVSWSSLKSLKLGGLVSTGSVLKYLLADCPNIRVLCYSLYEEQAEQVTDTYIEQLLLINPMPALVAFYIEKCVLTEQSFFHLVNNLPSLRYLGMLSEWLGLDRRGRLTIHAYIRGNNLALDVDSLQDSGGHFHL